MAIVWTAEHRDPAGTRRAERGEHLLQPPAQAEPGQHARPPRPPPDHRGLGQHAAEHLAPAGPDAAQQGELAGPLRGQDAEGVADDDAGDDQGDQREDRIPSVSCW